MYVNQERKFFLTKQQQQKTISNAQERQTKHTNNHI